MKQYKLLSLLTIALAISLSACHKRGDYICVCAGGFAGNHYEEREVPGKSKKDASNKCEALGNPVGTPDGITCALKE